MQKCNALSSSCVPQLLVIIFFSNTGVLLELSEVSQQQTLEREIHTVLIPGKKLEGYPETRRNVPSSCATSPGVCLPLSASLSSRNFKVLSARKLLLLLLPIFYQVLQYVRHPAAPRAADSLPVPIQGSTKNPCWERERFSKG